MKNHLDIKPKEDSKCYFPSINRFEGYTHFPRPLCQPFTNIPGQFVKIEDVLIDVENLLNGTYDNVDESKFLFIGKYHE